MRLPKVDQTSDNEMPAVCIEVLRELIENGAVKSDESGAIAALLIDFHGYGIIKHATLRRLALSKFVNRSLEPGEKI